MPPIEEDFSNMRGEKPYFSRWRALTMPAGPAPIIATFLLPPKTDADKINANDKFIKRSRDREISITYKQNPLFAVSMSFYSHMNAGLKQILF